MSASRQIYTALTFFVVLLYQFGTLQSDLSAEDGPAKVVDQDEEKMRKLHREAARLAARKQSYTEEFHDVLTSLVDTFPKAKVTSAGEPIKWNSVTLNHKGYRFGGIQFRSTLDESADMYWIGSSKPQFQRWYIYPMRGAIRGFRDRGVTANLPDLDFPDQKNVIIQELTGGNIHPRIDYVIWFVMDFEESMELKYAIRLIPKQDNPEIPGHRKTPQEFLEKLQPFDETK